MGDEESHIEVANLWKVFGSRPERALDPGLASRSRGEIQEELGLLIALRDVSFKVRRGEVFVVMGLSGSGKSTLARCLIRLVEASKGQVYFDGEDILEYSPEQLMAFRRSKVAMVFQHYALLPHRRVLDNVAYGLEIRGVEEDARYKAASETIETVGLKGWEDYYPREMSGGMQQRVGLARALAVDPEVLLMDEPFSGLDPLIRREMQDELVSLHSGLGKTIVFITHDLNEALKLGDRIAIMRDGEIIQEGSPEEIVTLPTDDYVAEFVRDVSRAKVIQAGAIMREPDATVYEWQGPRAALHTMDNSSHEALFLVARDSTLRGILTEEQARTLASQGLKSLASVNVTPAQTAGPETPIEDIIPLAARSRHPIAVVSDDGKLLGEIRRGTLLTGISSRD